jgi:hypothetical protein
LNPKRELNARSGEARMEYVVDREPVRGVRVKVSVYGEAGIPDAAWKPVGGGVEVEPLATGSVVNRTPVESPMTEDSGE